MSATLVKVASYVSGISTPHYLYFSEAVSNITKAGTAVQAVGDLQNIPDHRQIMQECGFPTSESPDDLLARVTQSTAYHLSIAARPGVVQQIVASLNRTSRIEPAPSLMLSHFPQDQAVLFDFRSFDLSRGIRQLFCSNECYERYAPLPTPRDTMMHLMDVFLPAFHWMNGALMFLGILQFRSVQGSADRNDMDGWFGFTQRLVGMLSGLYEWFTPMVHSTNRAFTIQPGKSLEILEEHEAYNLIMTLSGIHLGLQSLDRNLQVWKADWVARFRERIFQVESEQSSPLLERLGAIIDGRPYGDERS